MRKNFIDLTGQRFGRLTVVRRAEKNDYRGSAVWVCRCDCGEKRELTGTVLRGGKVISCGCFKRDQKTSHGASRTRLYQIWINMRRRCTDEREKDYPRYGGRGITICKEWMESFEPFRDWAISNGYREDLTLERNDNDGPYSPDNCRWATYEEQANNRRNNVWIACRGENHTLAEWERILGLRPGSLSEYRSSGKDVLQIIERTMDGVDCVIYQKEDHE